MPIKIKSHFLNENKREKNQLVTVSSVLGSNLSDSDETIIHHSFYRMNVR